MLAMQDPDVLEKFLESISVYDAAAYATLAGGTALLLEILKKVLGAEKLKGHEPKVILGLILVLGIGAKLATPIALYQEMPWFAHIVALFVAVGGSFKAHDWFLNPIIGKKDPSAQPEENKDK